MSLGSKCIIKIIDYCLDLTTYDLIDALYHNRVGSIVLSYRLIEKLCQLLNLNHLFDKILSIYCDKLTLYLEELINMYHNICGICNYCGYQVIFDYNDHNFYMSRCENGHQIIWTNGSVDNYFFTTERDIISEYGCLDCNNDIDTDKIVLAENHIAIFNSDGTISIIDKKPLNYIHSFRRTIKVPDNIPKGLAIYRIDKTLVTCKTGCGKYGDYWYVERVINPQAKIKISDTYIEKIYSMYQETTFTDQEMKRIISLFDINTK